MHVHWLWALCLSVCTAHRPNRSPRSSTLPCAVTLRCFGGEAAGASALAPKVGPLGLSAKKIADDIAKNTLAYKGLRITVKLLVQNRKAQVEVVPSASSCVIKALAEAPRDRKKEKNSKANGIGMVVVGWEMCSDDLCLGVCCTCASVSAVCSFFPPFFAPSGCTRAVFPECCGGGPCG